MKKLSSLPVEIRAIMWICFCVFSAYHAPQPLFPAIQGTFGVPQSSVSLITTCIILPLGLSPIFYGMFLNRLPLVRTLTTALLLYGLALLPAPLGGGWYALLGGRIVQGFTLPAVILCAMTYISTRFEGRTLQQYMSFYAVSCMLGGFFGRILAGWVEQITGEWRMSFAVMALTILTSLPCTRMLPPVKGSFKRMDFHALGALFRQKGMLLMLMIAPCLALVNNSILNVLPFRLREIDPSITPLAISLVYIGVVLCSTSGIFSSQIIRLLRTEMRAVCLSVLLFVVSLPLLFVPSSVALFFILIVLNFGYAFMYACLPGIVNRYSLSDKAVTNGVFLTSYYLSGAAGSYFPVLIYENAGFSVYWTCIFVLSCTALAVAFIMRKVNVDQCRT